MNKKELIRFFSEFWEINPSDVTDDLVLDDENLKNQTSARFYQFIAAVESNFDVKVQNLNEIVSFGDLCKNLSPVPA